MLDIIQNARLAACTQSPITSYHVPPFTIKSMWAGAIRRTIDALNHTATARHIPVPSRSVEYGMGLPHLLRRTRSFAEYTAARSARRDRSRRPRSHATVWRGAIVILRTRAPLEVAQNGKLVSDCRGSLTQLCLNLVCFSVSFRFSS